MDYDTYEAKMCELEQSAREKGYVQGVLKSGQDEFKQSYKQAFREGERDGHKQGAQILASALKENGIPEQEIMQLLEQSYGNIFSKKELTDILAQS